MPVNDDDSVEHVQGISPMVDEVIAEIAGGTTPQKAFHPIQTQWPPSYLGFVPDSPTEPLHVAGLENVRSRTVSVIGSSDGLVNDPGSNPLLAIWSATRQALGKYDYLVLPPNLPGEADSNWLELHHPGYPSNKIMVRKCYEKAFSIFLRENAKLYRRGSHLALGGTSGLGKSFFYRYIIWSLFHPDGIEVHAIPDTIFLWTNPKGQKGYLYHHGWFYSIIPVGNFLGTALAENMFSKQDAWMICDGAPPTSYMECPIVVSSSPTNFQLNDITDAKKFFKTANCRVYLPPWTAEEIWQAARTIYGLTDEHEEHLLERFTKFGGIARSIFLNFKDPNKPLKDLFVLTDVTTAINEVGSTDLNHQKVSGMILHLIPDNTLTRITYQWGSTAIMETAFETMFRVSKNRIQTFLHAGIGLHLGTFYGLLFEPYFHARVTQQGYSGRIRRLTPSQNNDAIAPATSKRKWWGAKKFVTEVHEHTIPVQKINHFHSHAEIKMDSYNVPDRKNFAAVDAVAPALGEMYQVTSAENHSIKGIHLRPLKKFFQDHLATHKMVKVIFVVPPNRFETFKEQTYIFPSSTGKTDTRGKGKGVDKELQKDDNEEEYNSAPWDEDEAQEEVDEGKRTALLEQVTSWVDQWVMEFNVDPLLKTVDKRIESQVKRSFIQQWSPFNLKNEEKKTE